MNHGSLFTGIGGFNIASEEIGWETVFNCEIDKFCQRVLKYYWPNTIIYEDIKKTDFTRYRGTVDVLSGGPPCQPISVAGKRKGDKDDRWLWPDTIRAVREIKPAYCVFENPTGILSMEDGRLFTGILAALEDEGYEVECFIIPACSTGAPHKRDRVWIIAYSNKRRNAQSKLQQSNLSTRSIRNNKQITSDNTNSGIKGVQQRKNGVFEIRTSPDTRSQRLQGRKLNEASKQGGIKPGRENKGQPRKSVGKFCQGSNWIDFPTQSPIRCRDDGFSARLDNITFPKWRNESIKAYGNAIVPQIALELFKAIENYGKR